MLIQGVGLVWIVPTGWHHGSSVDIDTFRPWRTIVSGSSFKIIMICVLAMAEWSGVLIFFNTGHSSVSGGLIPMNGMSPWARWLVVISFLTLAPILEECIFRHYLQYRIALLLTRYRSGLALSIICCSLM